MNSAAMRVVYCLVTGGRGEEKAGLISIEKMDVPESPKSIREANVGPKYPPVSGRVSEHNPSLLKSVITKHEFLARTGGERVRTESLDQASRVGWLEGRDVIPGNLQSETRALILDEEFLAEISILNAKHYELWSKSRLHLFMG